MRCSLVFSDLVKLVNHVKGLDMSNKNNRMNRRRLYLPCIESDCSGIKHRQSSSRLLLMNQMQFTRATLASVMVLGLFMAMPTIVRGQSAHRNQQLVSFGDRLLLNRAALNGTEKLQVLLAVQIGKEASVIKHL